MHAVDENLEPPVSSVLGHTDVRCGINISPSSSPASSPHYTSHHAILSKQQAVHAMCFGASRCRKTEVAMSHVREVVEKRFTESKHVVSLPEKFIVERKSLCIHVRVPVLLT